MQGAGPHEQGEDPIAGAGRNRASAKESMKDLMKSLRDAQKTRPAMEIVRDVLGDIRVKLFADVPPGSTSRHVHIWQGAAS